MKRFILVIILLGGILLAQEVFALTISPPVMELESNPGQKIDEIIKLFNETDSQIVVYPTLANFKAVGEEGQPSFLEPTEITDYSLAAWIEIDKGPIQLAEDERKEIPFTIDVPLGAEPGGHYGAIFFGSQPPHLAEERTVIGVAGQIGSLVLLKVAGDIKEEGQLLEFGIKDGEKYFTFLPVDFYWRFENLGTVHLKPQGEILIKNIFGRTSDTVPANWVEVGGNVLPGSLRRFEASWLKTPLVSAPQGFFERLKAEKDNFALGRYEGDLVLEYGTGGKIAQASLIFWVFPWHLILVSVLGAALFIYLIIVGIKRYNRWIIRKAMGEGIPRKKI